MPVSRRAWRLWLRWMGLGALAGLTAGVAVAALGPGGLEWPFGRGSAPDGATPGQSVVGAAILPTTEMVFRWVGPECDEAITEQRPAGRDAVGATEPDLAILYPEWTVEGFGPERVVLARAYEPLCAELERYRLVTLKDDHIAVYYGRRPPLVKLKEVTRVPASSLRQADLERLVQGVVVEGDAGVVEFLEGLSN